MIGNVCARDKHTGRQRDDKVHMILEYGKSNLMRRSHLKTRKHMYDYDHAYIIRTNLEYFGILSCSI